MAVFLHTRIRVGDLDRSVKWYCDNLGFQVASRSDNSPAGNRIAHLQLPGNDHTLELTWSEDYSLEVPEDLMHLAIGYPDLIAECARLKSKGLEIWPDKWREVFQSGNLMAFVDDPDGYEIELLQRA